MKFLVTGGAGYIGSFMVKRLLDDGHLVIVVDDLARGIASNLDSRAQFFQGNLLDKKFTESLFTTSFDGVFHFAAFISMGESMEHPQRYFENNVQASLNLIEAMRKSDCKNIIFSSTAGVYGNPVQIPIPEDHQKNPENPYGESKLMVERLLAWYQKIFKINYVVLRYFNASGAALDGSMGEQHNPETHIIPNIINAALNNKPFTLYGADYKTNDGTCVRDYIHVYDLIEAHVLAFQKLQQKPGSYIFNVGTGNGYSNKEVVDMVKKVSNIDFQVVYAQRRPGDADTLIANVTRIQDALGFKAKYSELESIVESAWKWHKNLLKHVELK